MKRLNIALLTASLALFSMSACAGHRHHGLHKAKVVHATPIYQTVRYPFEEQVCWDEQLWRRHHPNALPTVAGAVIGGVVGNQLVHGDGRALATVAGAAVGGAVGYQLSRKDRRHGEYPVTRTRCEVRQNWRTEQHITGWDVAYRYRGRVYHTWMPEQPGKHIRVNVNVMPAPYYPGR